MLNAEWHASLNNFFQPKASIRSLSSLSSTSSRNLKDKDSSVAWSVLDFSIADQTRKNITSLKVSDVEFVEAMKETDQIHPVSSHAKSKLEGLRLERDKLLEVVNDDNVQDITRVNAEFEAAREALKIQEAKFFIVETCEKQALQRLQYEKSENVKDI